MHPIIHSQAKTLAGLLAHKDPVAARLYLERCHLPVDVQDLIFAAIHLCPAASERLLAHILDMYHTDTSFDERIVH